MVVIDLSDFVVNGLVEYRSSLKKGSPLRDSVNTLIEEWDGQYAYRLMLNDGDYAEALLGKSPSLEDYVPLKKDYKKEKRAETEEDKKFRKGLALALQRIAEKRGE